MNAQEFNKKYKNHIEKDFYGLAIDNIKVIEFLDKEFEEEIKANPNFKFSQIKLKFGMARVYSNSRKDAYWEEQINRIYEQDKK